MNNLNEEKITKDILNFGAKYAKSFKVDELEFSNRFRDYCKDNLCGHYGTNWMCPPGVGEIDKLKCDLMKFTKGVVYQTIHPVKNIKDRKETDRIRDTHNQFTRSLSKHLKNKYNTKDIFPMGAGPCVICKNCSYIKGEECIYPEEAISSAEAYGIDLGAILKSCGLKFNYSEDTLAYVGIILFH